MTDFDPIEMRRGPTLVGIEALRIPRKRPWRDAAGVAVGLLVIAFIASAFVAGVMVGLVIAGAHWLLVWGRSV